MCSLQDEDYHGIVQFSASLVDSQLFVHYLAVVLLELRHLHPCYNVCVIRSTDGETRHYNIGQLRFERLLSVLMCMSLYLNMRHASILICYTESASERKRQTLMKSFLCAYFAPGASIYSKGFLVILYDVKEKIHFEKKKKKDKNQML